MSVDVIPVPPVSLGRAEVNGREYTVVRHGMIVWAVLVIQDRMKGYLWRHGQPVTPEVLEIMGAARYPT